MKSSCFCGEIYIILGIGAKFFSIYPKSYRCNESDITRSENIEFFRERIVEIVYVRKSILKMRNEM